MRVTGTARSRAAERRYRRLTHGGEIVRRLVVKAVEYQHTQFTFHTLSGGQPMTKVSVVSIRLTEVM